LTLTLTTPLRILAMVDNSKMGCRSFEIEVGGQALGIGTTSADFHIEGKYPSLIEALNMAANS